ncbi:Hsp33 family molecular chaperone HslO [Neisseria sp. DTU_2020_1000833_1_SI_GRL_NUU_006]|jgi:hsp33 protein|uniref:33 kDa chaperonin n=1 Tax=Neisseria mucosa TaxID=488 RepID=A0ABN4Y5T2_NEIMU|nr:Hsp33 family molecular chaperone HslO [Neisseria mucosa]OFJ55892.1 molecular chaperone Hsp33 [Neisseria sp. HMSC073B07]OFV30849.1 molecular chaperone Hsp33 [Neisseria sp. HMSC15C08]WNU96646.1 Hsp33 family molecular chaperone HslO [Neisseria sp. DTU_2020_1000833_1_SI_GRL_NUU_006]ARC50221.1 Hsp33 family molecular chaperone HslO [Neisseria mucosa]AVR79673.1 Hsp33 family molecular chaperone HslO [Neisseria mucosa]
MPQTQINHADIRTRFIFDDMPVRGLHVRLENVWKHIVGQKHYPAAIRRALGELLAAGALLSGNLKTDGTLIVQVQGQGRLKMLVVEATSDQTVRATARWDETAEINDDESLTDLLGSNSVFVLTLQPKDAEPWQGVVPLEGGSIAQMLINYTKRSEQLDTQIVLASSDDACGGLLVQRLPETEPDAASWEHVGTLVQTLTPEELTGLDAQHVLYRLFHETPPRVFDPESIEFACTCSRGKVSDMLLMLGGEEVGGVVAEQGSIQIDCDFCHAKYVFDETDVNALFGADVVNAVLDEAKRLQ